MLLSRLNSVKSSSQKFCHYNNESMINFLVTGFERIAVAGFDISIKYLTIFRKFGKGYAENIHTSRKWWLQR